MKIWGKWVVGCIGGGRITEAGAACYWRAASGCNRGIMFELLQTGFYSWDFPGLPMSEVCHSTLSVGIRTGS